MWHESDILGNHRRIEATHLTDVRVAVTLKQLQSPHHYSITQLLLVAEIYDSKIAKKQFIAALVRQDLRYHRLNKNYGVSFHQIGIKTVNTLL